MDVARPSRKKEIRRKRILWGIVAVAVLVGITVGLNSLEPAAREVDRASIYSGVVERGEMLRAVRGAGSLVPEEIRFVAANTDGRVERVLIDAGARVTPDTVILVLTNPELAQSAEEAELQLRAAEATYRDLEVRLDSQLLDQKANLARVKADYEAAQLQREADQELYDAGLISEIQLRRSELSAEQLTVRYEIEQQRLTKAGESVEAQLAVQGSELAQQRALSGLRRGQVGSLEVRAGIQGVLQQVAVEVGQRVSPGTTLARVANPEVLQAELRIQETQARDVEVGQTASIDTRNGVIDGRVARIDPSVRNGTVTVDVELTGEYPRGARPDLTVDGTIELERLVDVLHVGKPTYGQPFSTVGLFKITPDGFAHRVQVELGRSSVTRIEVVSGLAEGDEVILSDTSQWDDVDRIRLR